MTRIESNTFAAACYDMNSIADLEHALTFDEADATDCATWNITPAQWREQIELALTSLREDTAEAAA